MAPTSTLVTIALAAAAVVPATANAFLRATAADRQLVASRAVEETLLTELAMLGRDEHLARLGEELRPMFQALPKNAEGRLDAAVVRYGLHRFFVQSRGWYVQGLQPSGEAWNSSSSVQLVKDRVPSFIQGILEKRVNGHGLDLQDLAAFAATIQDLIHAEAMQNMMDTFSLLELPLHGHVSEADLSNAIEVYLMGYLLGTNVSTLDTSGVTALRRDILEVYPAWPDVDLWARDLQKAFFEQQRGSVRPFDRDLDFDVAAAVVQDVGHHFGAFQDQECRSMKDMLVDMEYRGSGRVRLSDFYRGGLDGNWQFAESVDYLRAMGALDESDPQMPAVIIANYVGSQSNCLASSSFYSVCCMDECEGLMGQLERAIGEPSAEPGRLAELVAGMASDTVDAPRELSPALLGRLGEIAAHHGGQVPLHGRLFAQFMHHAYPRECPFPHSSGTTNPMTPNEWMDEHGLPEASPDEIRRHLEAGLGRNESSGHSEDTHGALPWTSLEELVAVHEPTARAARQASALGLTAKALLLLAFGGLSVPMLRSIRSNSAEDKLPRYMV